MAKRDIVKIDEKKCTGCGLCVPNCYEGAIKIIDGKARLISDLFCDGLGACIGHCPEGAIKIEKREAKEYNEVEVMKKNIIPKGENTIKAHLEHLREHNVEKYLKEAVDYLNKRGLKNPLEEGAIQSKEFCGCPGSRIVYNQNQAKESKESGKRGSHLNQWPIQLHLISPVAPYYLGKDVLLAADCTAYSLGDFHKDYLKGKSLAIACPKLDSNQEIYVNKIKSMIDDAKIKSLTVLTMEVPCCGGLVQIAKNAASLAKRKIDVKSVVVGIDGTIRDYDS